MNHSKSLNNKESNGHRDAPEKGREMPPVSDGPFAGKPVDNEKTDVKNAHEAGDGAMGPNDTPLPDLDKKTEDRSDEETPY